MRRPIYECRACGRYCTTRTNRTDDIPSRCLFWHDFASWVRIDKHAQKQLSEFGPSADPAEDQELAGLGRGVVLMEKKKKVVAPAGCPFAIECMEQYEECTELCPYYSEESDDED